MMRRSWVVGVDGIDVVAAVVVGVAELAEVWCVGVGDVGTGEVLTDSEEEAQLLGLLCRPTLGERTRRMDFVVVVVVGAPPDDVSGCGVFGR